MYRRRHRGLSVLLSAALVAGLVPAPALAEVRDELQPEEVTTEQLDTADDQAADAAVSSDEQTSAGASDETVSNDADGQAAPAAAVEAIPETSTDEAADNQANAQVVEQAEKALGGGQPKLTTRRPKR